MDRFDNLLIRAKQDDQAALTKLILLYRPVLFRLSQINRSIDDDLYQDLLITFIRCVHKFRI